VSALHFQITGSDGNARRGLLRTAHGLVETPAFMPVATYGAVRGVSASDLEGIGAQIVLANTFHLHERPGEALVAEAGGLHGFTGWPGPWLTDSGGFQITSLADRAKIDERGVVFASPVDGQRRELTPEIAVGIQEALGADIAMALDECVPVDRDDPEGAERAVLRSLRWAERCQAARSHPTQALFGIVQGGAFAELRRQSAEGTAALGFDGHAHGGLGLGEAPEERIAMVAAAHDALPPERPRYLMGLGRPEDLLDGVAHGVDLFDCVVPTRHARHGHLFTSQGVLAIRNARHRESHGPPDPACDCPTCGRFSRSYLRHLFLSGESLGPRLASLHNLRFYLRLLEQARAAITEGRFGSFERSCRAEVCRPLPDDA
jgi:queuine tRNA-ribosyltransferase